MPKIKRKLTETEIRNAKPRAKPYRLYDEGGLRLLVRPSGTKVWQYRYILNSKENIHTIGTYGNGPDQIGSAEARRLCAEAKALLKQGIDPNNARKSERTKRAIQMGNTFEAVGRDWYSKQSWAPRHAKTVMSRLTKDVFPLIGFKPIAEVDVSDILAILKKAEARNALDVARRVNQYCTSIFEHGIVMGLCNQNPAMGRSKILKSYTSNHHPHLNEADIADFRGALGNTPAHNLTALAVTLLALTFVRPGEFRGARWEEIDIARQLWTIPASRMKMKREHLVPLSSQAISTLEKIRHISGDSAFLFPGSLRKPFSETTLNKAVKRYTAGKATPHGFRHTASTILNEHGFNGDHIERQLAHVETNKVRGTYNKALYLEDRRVMMQWWADYICPPLE